MNNAEEKVPKGSYAAGRKVRLPQGAVTPITVYINGQAQIEGVDYEIDGNEILFTRSIIKEELSFSRKAAMFFSFFGTYRKHETVDVQFTKDGRTELAADLPIFE